MPVGSQQDMWIECVKILRGRLIRDYLMLEKDNLGVAQCSPCKIFR
jgi:hypothetical protein